MIKFNKILLLIITAVLLLNTASACNIHWLGVPENQIIPQTEPPPEEPLPEPQRPSNNRNNFTPFTPYDDTVLITVGRYFNTTYDSLNSFRPGVNGVNNMYIEMLIKELNIQLEVIFNVPEDEYMETLLRHRAAGTLPDTFRLHNSYEGMLFFNELVSNNELGDLTKALTESVGGLSFDALTGWDFDELFKFVKVNDSILATGYINNNASPPLTWIRQDWLSRVELEVPKTLEEFEEAALSILRVRLGGWDMPAFTFFPGEMFEPQHGILPVFIAFNAYPTNWIEINGKVEWGGIQPEVKEALALMRDWNQNRIITNQLLGMDRDQIVNRFITRQRTGIFFSDRDQPFYTFNRRGDASQIFNEDMLWVPFLGPVGADGVYRPMVDSVRFGGQVVLNTHSNPEAVIKAMNLIGEVADWRNPEFEHLWEKYIKPVENTQTASSIMPIGGLISPDFYPEVAKVFENYNNTGILEIPEMPLLSDSRFMIEQTARSVNGGMDAWWELSKDDRVAILESEDDSILQQFLDNYIWYWSYREVGLILLEGLSNGSYAPVSPAFSATTPLWDEYSADLMKLQQDTFIKIISGRLPLEAFDEFVAKWLTEGGEAVTFEVNHILRR